MTTYGDLMDIPAGTRLIFNREVTYCNWIRELRIPHGATAELVANEMREPRQILILRAESPEVQAAVDFLNETPTGSFNQMPKGTFPIGPRSEGAAVLTEPAPVDLL